MYNKINTWSELMLQENLTILLANEFINLSSCKIKYELIEFHHLISRIIQWSPWSNFSTLKITLRHKTCNTYI